MSGTSILKGRIKFVPRLAVLILDLLSIPSIGFAAGADEIQLPWSEIAALVDHQKVALLLPDGAMIEGQVLAVEPDALVLDIKKSSDPRSHPPERSSIPRSSVSVLQLKQVKGNRRWLGAAIGAGGGGVAGWLVAEGVFHVSGEGLNASKTPVVVGSVAGLVAGAAAIGYFAGREGDRRVTFIKIIPASNPQRSRPGPTALSPTRRWRKTRDPFPVSYSHAAVVMAHERPRRPAWLDPARHPAPRLQSSLRDARRH